MLFFFFFGGGGCILFWVFGFLFFLVLSGFRDFCAFSAGLALEAGSFFIAIRWLQRILGGGNEGRSQ